MTFFVSLYIQCFHVLFYSNLSFFLHYFQFFLMESNWENLRSKLGKKDTILHWEWGRISAPNSADREPWKTTDFELITSEREFHRLNTVFVVHI